MKKKEHIIDLAKSFHKHEEALSLWMSLSKHERILVKRSIINSIVKFRKIPRYPVHNSTAEILEKFLILINAW